MSKWVSSEGKACTGKVGYSSRSKAAAHKRQMIATGRKGLRRKAAVDRPLEVYHCNFCDQWHVGHSIPRPKYDPHHNWSGIDQ